MWEIITEFHSIKFDIVAFIRFLADRGLQFWDRGVELIFLDQIHRRFVILVPFGKNHGNKIYKKNQQQRNNFADAHRYRPSASKAFESSKPLSFPVIGVVSPR